jgi:uncharacterized protein (TIGR02145 family)
MALYVSSTGSDSTGNGTIGSPWLTLNKAWSNVSAGDIIYMRGGTYQYTSQQNLTGKNGSAGNLIKVWAYPGETPVITRAESFTYSIRAGIYFSGDYVHWKGLEITGFYQVDGGVFFGFRGEYASHNIFELLNSHHNGHGMVMSNGCDDNLILNSDFHHNYDPLTSSDPYGNADGLEFGITAFGAINTVRGCRFWNNSDDGIDLWLNDGLLIVDRCWAWNNGYTEDGTTEGGDGNGFKLGTTSDYFPTTHIRTVTNCLSFHNRNFGFTQNQAHGVMHIYNNTGYHNADAPGENGALTFWFHDDVNDGYNISHIIRNNIAHANQHPTDLQANWEHNSVQDHNTWNGVVTVTDADFVSVDMTGVDGARQSNGNLPVLNFLKLATGSDLIGAGVDVGLATDGAGNAWNATPSMGAYESGSFESIPVTAITVTGAGSATTITVNDGTLQMSVHVDPHDATDDSVTWTRINGTGEANISSSGLLTAISDGTVTVRATANDGSGVYDDLVVTISNQEVAEPEVATERSRLFYYDNLIQRILIMKPCTGYYLRWYFCGWHYWFFLSGTITTLTEGEAYRTLGTRKLTMSSGQITREQVKAIRTLMHTREVSLLQGAGWANIRIEPGTVVIYDNQVNGAEIEFTAIVGSKTTFSPVQVVPPIDPTDYDPPCECVIGSQVWMCKNWDGAFPGSKVYDNNESNRAIYGGLYTYNQIMTAGFIPKGWHIPTRAEYETLFTFVGGAIVAGGALKESGNNHWTDNVFVSPVTCFEALGAGYGYKDTFTNQIVFGGLKNYAYLWTATESGTGAYFVRFAADSVEALISDTNKQDFLSVRLLRDTTVTNKEIYGGLYNWYAANKNGGTGVGSIAPTGWHVPSFEEFDELTIFVGGTISGGELKETGFDHWESPNIGATNNYGFSWLGHGWRESVFGVFENLKLSGTLWTTYVDPFDGAVRNANVQHADIIVVGYGGGDIKNLGCGIRCLMSDPSGWQEGDTVTDVDGNVYETVKIGDQVWMSENLKTEHFNNGDTIPIVTDDTAWVALTTPGTCYYNNE